MINDTLAEREFELINIIGPQLATQRDISRHLDWSLGTVNILLRRLIAKGYIRIKRLNKRKFEYVLTPKGFAEKMRKSVNYTWKTIHSITVIKNQLKELVLSLYGQGHRQFFVLGKSDLAVLVEMALKETGLKECCIVFLDDLPVERVEGLLLICRENVPEIHSNRENAVDLVRELAKKSILENGQ